jgi:hypothetical protein
MRTQFWWGNLRKRDHLREIGVDWKVIFKLALRKKHGMAWTDFIWFKIGKNGGFCEHDIEPFDFVLTEKMLGSEKRVSWLVR